MNGLSVEGSPIVAKLARNTGGPGGTPAAPVYVTPIRAVPARGLTPQAAFRGTPGVIPGERVYVKGLPAGMTDEAVRHLFAGYGSVADSKVLVADGQTSDGTGQSVAIVRMATVAEAQWIVDNLNGNIPETLERPVDVSFAGARPGRPLATPRPTAPAPQATARWRRSRARRRRRCPGRRCGPRPRPWRPSPRRPRRSWAAPRASTPCTPASRL
eukprot:SRR837773.16801.p1 GENE.SRR837773.16801~~SRR837773.16801.p1  ORF type:complete len:221 (-),score=20.87 SRR837773.16801:13-654(-)